MDQRELSVGHIPAGAQCDFRLVDNILRLQLAAVALGWSIRLQQVCPRLRELTELVGCSERLGM